jgi:hypothetical protein
MKKNISWLMIVLFIALAGTAWYLFNKKPDKISVLMEDRNFAVADTAKIQKIFLATRDQAPITLERINGVWMLNGIYKASVNPVKNLLETIKNIRLQSIPSKGQAKTIMEGIAVYGIKVEIYDQHEKIRTYYVGGPTQQEYGTYFYMEHGSQPYTLEIPQFVGNVRERFDLELLDWRDKTIFDFTALDVSLIKLEYPYHQEHSFVLNKIKEEWSISDFNKLEPGLKKIKSEVIYRYLDAYEKIGAEEIQNSNPIRKEIANLKPYCSLTIKLNSNPEPLQYHFYPIEIDSAGKVRFNFNEEQINEGKIFRMQVDRSNGDFLLVQYPNLVGVLKYKEDFIK